MPIKRTITSKKGDSTPEFWSQPEKVPFYFGRCCKYVATKMPCAIKEQLWRLFIWEATLRFKKQQTSTAAAIVGKKWEPRNPVPGPFSAKIRKLNQNSESSQKFGNLILKIRKKLGKLSKIRKVRLENSESWAKFGKIEGWDLKRKRKRKKGPHLFWDEKLGNFSKIRKAHPEN